MNLVMKASKNLGARLLALAILTMLFTMPVAVLADMNDYVTDYGLTEFYAQTSWPGLHRDSRNSDFSPFVAPLELAEKWTALNSYAVIAPIVIGPEGNIYVTTGKGSNNLHAFSRDGIPLWSRGLDPGAVGSAVIVDVDGNVYISDSDQFWAFHPDGSLKWDPPVSFEEIDITGTFGSSAFTVDGYVGGITTNGEVVILNRDDGSLAASILSLPGEEGPDPPTTPAGLWKNMIDTAFIDDLYASFFGYKFEVTNTPAVNPVNNRIYIAAAGPTPAQGTFYGIDFTPGNLSIAFQTPMGPGSGTSPAISPDGSRVYVADGNGILYAFDADGIEKWSYPVGETAASPSIGSEGIIYVLGNGLVHAIDSNGIPLWVPINFDSIASQYLAPIDSFYLPGKIGWSGTPISKADSIISVTPDYLYIAVNLGYEVDIFLPLPVPHWVKFFVPKETVMLVLNRVNGQDESDVVLRDTCDGVLTIGSDGSIYIPHGSAARSIAYNSLNNVLYRLFRAGVTDAQKLMVAPPIGGISALKPVLFLDLVKSGIHWVQDLDAGALDNLDSGDVDEAYTQVRRGVVQLGATFSSISDAEPAEIDSQSAQQARQRVDTAQVLLNNAKNHIAQARIDPNEGLLNSAKQLIENAEFQLEQALSSLAGPAAPPIAKTISNELRFSEGIPVKSELVQNYPNPFNPETWIPYNLAKDANVVVEIYSVSGQLVRTLDLVHKDAGFYLSKDKAAYWNGRDNLGEKVASGIYFYTLKAGDFRATRRMLIMK